jgi:glycosyltransferase involved in cell wall biosynthesis
VRVAFFSDSYLEVNGVALTSKRLENFARRREFPFLTIHAGKKTQITRDGSVTRYELKRSALSISLDEELKYDPLFQRHFNRVKNVASQFRPDVIHITGLNDVSILGAWLAYRTKTPVLASWHTNIHEFSAQRLNLTLKFVPEGMRRPFIKFIENQIFRGAVLYYKLGKVLLAPNQELVDALKEGTNRAAHLMIRGVDVEIFAPEKRTVNDNTFRLGFCGRLQPEKNVRLLADLEKELLAAGKTNYKFLIVGDGSERAWLEQNLKQVEFTGFIDGEKLSEAYANMDVFVFPSETDTFGNVIQEANASGVPAIVATVGGPKYIVKHNQNGFIAENLQDFTKYTLELMSNPAQLTEMRQTARKFVLSRSWDSVFEQVYQAYAECRDAAISTTIEKRDLSVASL